MVVHVVQICFCRRAAFARKPLPCTSMIAKCGVYSTPRLLFSPDNLAIFVFSVVFHKFAPCDLYCLTHPCGDFFAPGIPGGELLPGRWVRYSSSKKKFWRKTLCTWLTRWYPRQWPSRCTRLPRPRRAFRWSSSTRKRPPRRSLQRKSCRRWPSCPRSSSRAR